MSRTDLPSELLHEIVTYVVADFVNDAIAGHFALQPLPLPSPYEPYPDEEGWSSKIVEVLAKDPINTVPNPVTPLFSVSFCVREVVLKVLSTVLGIPLAEHAITR